MINKQSLWFLTLFSIILVLSVYYIAMTNNKLATLKENDTNKTHLPKGNTILTTRLFLIWNTCLSI